MPYHGDLSEARKALETLSQVRGGAIRLAAPTTDVPINAVSVL
jgi:hypothetical protein